MFNYVKLKQASVVEHLNFSQGHQFYFQNTTKIFFSNYLIFIKLKINKHPRYF